MRKPLTYTHQSQFLEMFGSFPNDTRWGEVVTITNGKKYPLPYSEKGSYPICGSGGELYRGELKLCEGGTTVLGRKGNINDPYFMSEPYWIVDTAFSLKTKEGKLRPLYFYYWCKLFDFTKLNKQAVLPSLTKSDLEEILVSCPPMELQNQFETIYRQADKSKYYELN